MTLPLTLSAFFAIFQFLEVLPLLLGRIHQTKLDTLRSSLPDHVFFLHSIFLMVHFLLLSSLASYSVFSRVLTLIFARSSYSTSLSTFTNFFPFKHSFLPSISDPPPLAGPIKSLEYPGTKGNPPTTGGASLSLIPDRSTFQSAYLSVLGDNGNWEWFYI